MPPFSFGVQMILVDMSSSVHRMIHGAVKEVKPSVVNDKYVTSQYVNYVKDSILQSLFIIKTEHEKRFGDVVICLDKSVNGYWRKDVLPEYKEHRKKIKEESLINFPEVFKEIDELIEQIKLNFPWKVVEVPRAEADDIILVLAKEYSRHENILIYSPDKDMLQAQRDNDTVFQYSGMTRKWLVPENKNSGMEQWIHEHVILGDASDNVPKVVDRTEFSESFLEHLELCGFGEYETPMDLMTAECSQEDKVNMLKKFNIYKTNRKGEKTEVLDVYKTMSFGPKTLWKKVNDYGSVEKWLESHPLYQKHYDRNYKLVMSEGIPTNIWNEILIAFKTAESDYHDEAVKEYLTNNDMSKMLMEMPNHFKINRSLTVDDFGW